MRSTAAGVGRFGSSAGLAGLEQTAAHVPQLFGAGSGTRCGEDCSSLHPPVDSRQHGCLTAAVDVSVCWSSQQSASTPARQSAGGATSSQTIASLSSPRIINRILRPGRRLFKDRPSRRLQNVLSNGSSTTCTDRFQPAQKVAAAPSGGRGTSGIARVGSFVEILRVLPRALPGETRAACFVVACEARRRSSSPPCPKDMGRPPQSAAATR